MIRKILASIGFALSLVLLASMTLGSTPVDQGKGGEIYTLLMFLYSIGIPTTFTYATLEFTANIVMFIPLGFFLTMLLPRRQWWIALVLLPLGSGFIETAQGLFLAQRTASLSDVVANSLGGFIGVGLERLFEEFLRLRSVTMNANSIKENT
jgi:glycopeptide antibiotics resistance protein